MDIHHHRHFRIANCKTADFPRRIEIAFHRRWRNEEQVRDVVEAAADVVGGRSRSKSISFGSASRASRSRTEF